MSIEGVRAVADAVLYEGYLLYPYRASSRKNQSRWQFGVLGPPHAARASFSEPPGMSFECLFEQDHVSVDHPAVTVHLRFLQVVERRVERREGDGFVAVDELVVDEKSWLSWEEAVEHEHTFAAYSLAAAFSSSAAAEAYETTVEVPGGVETTPLQETGGAVVGQVTRHRRPLVARVRVEATGDDDYARLGVSVENAHPDLVSDKAEAIGFSLIGAHVLVEGRGGRFVSLLEPPEEAVAAAARCHHERCWPVLAGPEGSRDVVLGSPIILYDHPSIAEESAGALFDSTEIDEILTLRVMTMTDEEKLEARATDPRAAEIIDRCDSMSPETLQQLHGVLRNPHGVPQEPTTFETGDVPWWDPAADESVDPEVDSVVINGIAVSKGSVVRVHPSRRADAQDLFFEGQLARVTAVLSDVDGETHVALVLLDDPAADLHDWYGRYLYFAPDELEPLTPTDREESRS